MKLSFSVPSWLLPKRIVADLDRRSAFNGTASRNWRRGWPWFGIEVTVISEPPHK